MPAIDDLVRVSGYSRSTVFRFLAGKAVRPAAADAIRTAMRATGFRSGEAPHRDDVAVLISTPPGFQGFRGFAEAIEGIMARASALRIPVIIDEAHAANRKIGAIVVGKGIREEEAELTARAAAGIPCVLVNRLVERAEASWVSVDFREAAGDAVKRFAAAGCRRIACRAAPENRRVDIHKEEGFRRAAEREGIEAIIFEQNEQDLQNIASEALGRPDRPDGWFTLNDEDAMRVIRAAHTLGLRVPGDLSVIGVNDVAGAAFFSPAITSVSVPFRACGEAAVDAMLHLLDNPLQRSIKVLMRHSLAERESCAPVHTTNPRSNS